MFRMRYKAAGVALAAALIGGIALATPASAAELGEVGVSATTEEASASWGAGWDKCRATYPSTKSIRRGPSNVGADESGANVKWLTYWTCYDTTNAT
jgi:hypothetical protein